MNIYLYFLDILKVKVYPKQKVKPHMVADIMMIMMSAYTFVNH